MNFVLDLIHKLGLVLIHKLELMLESVLMHKLSLEQELLCNLDLELENTLECIQFYILSHRFALEPVPKPLHTLP